MLLTFIRKILGMDKDHRCGRDLRFGGDFFDEDGTVIAFYKQALDGSPAVQTHVLNNTSLSTQLLS